MTRHFSQGIQIWKLIIKLPTHLQLNRRTAFFCPFMVLSNVSNRDIKGLLPVKATVCALLHFPQEQQITTLSWITLSYTQNTQSAQKLSYFTDYIPMSISLGE